MLETCASMTFPDFQRLMEWCQSYFANMSLKVPIGVYGYHTTHVYLICIKFTTFNMSMQISVQILFGQIWPPIWLYMKRNGSNTCMTFSTPKQNKPLFGVPCTKFLWYECFAAQIKFCCESDLQWTFGSKKIVWYGNSGRHVTHDHAIKFRVALDPA